MAVTGTTFSAKGGTASTAELRALGAQFSAAIASAGMVKTTDTGQVDWTTITWVTGVQTWGYEVWRFNDALQATKPVFIRLLYTQTTQNILGITAQVGTATDGAGNLASMAGTGTSVTTARAICSNGASTSTTTVSPSYIYGDGSALVMAITPDRHIGGATGFGGLLILERARALDGSALGDGVVCFWLAGATTTTTVQTVFLHNLYAQPAALSNEGLFPSASSGTPASTIIGANMYTFPWFTGFTPRLGAPSTMVIGTARNDMTVGNVFACDHYGTSRSFVALTPTYAYAFCMNLNGGLVPALRIT